MASDSDLPGGALTPSILHICARPGTADAADTAWETDGASALNRSARMAIHKCTTFRFFDRRIRPL